MTRKFLCITVVAIFAIALGVFAVFDFDAPERRLCDAGVYDMLTPELIELYEKEIAGESVVSDKTASQLERSANRLKIDVNKLKALMLLQDLAGKVNRDMSLADLASMNEIKLLAFFKQCAEDYLATQPEGRRDELKKLLSDNVKLPFKL